METKFNFKSQICTSKSQSETLLKLGLKKETADCYLFEYEEGKYKVIAESWLDLIADEKYYSQYKDVCFPAWSLDRLMELVPHRYGEYCDYANYFMYYYNIPLDVVEQFVGETKYEYLIDCIEWLIKEGYFNKEYLV